MATDTPTETVTPGNTEEPSADATPQGPEDTTPETGGNGDQEPGTPQEPTQLPDTHPLVKAYAAQKEELKTLRATGQRVTELEAANASVKEELATTQAAQADLTATAARFSRLEEFLTEVGGPLGKALDSKSFTQALFETDTPVADLVTKWHQDNPSTISSALRSGSGTPSGGTAGLNDILRAAAK